jgi:hypothetical protein
VGHPPTKEYKRVHDDIRTEVAPGIEARAQAEPADDPRADGPGQGRIGVGGGDENVAKVQLAARWAEQYAGSDDSLDSALNRFKRAYLYIDSVTKLVDPTEA